MNSDLSLARSILGNYRAPDPVQLRLREAMLGFIDKHPTDAHLRSCLEGHLTASAVLLDATKEKCLLTFHRKLGKWLQLGGHCDGDANLPGVALRELIEESGIQEITIVPNPIDLDIHTIPARPGEPEHLHLDTRFLAYAKEGAKESISEESLELRWFMPEEAFGLETDESVKRLLRIAFREKL